MQFLGVLKELKSKTHEIAQCAVDHSMRCFCLPFHLFQVRTALNIWGRSNQSVDNLVKKGNLQLEFHLYKSLCYHGPPKPTFLEVFMVNILVFRWPKPLFFMVLGAHGS